MDVPILAFILHDPWKPPEQWPWQFIQLHPSIVTIYTFAYPFIMCHFNSLQMTN